MAGGRPRTVCPPAEELEELGIEMCNWIETHPEALHLSAWYSIQKWFIESVWEQMIRKPEFRGYYERAKKIVGSRYLDKDSRVRDGISHRWQRVYFNDVKEEENETLEFKAKVTAKEAANAGVTPEQIKYLQDNIKFNGKNEFIKKT